MRADTMLIAPQQWVQVSIEEESDVVMARKHAREFALQEGLSGYAIDALVTATSEIVNNVLVHARRGELLLGAVDKTQGHGVVVVVMDRGPGIADLERAMQDGYSTAHGLGLGLSSAKRLMDEFELLSQAGAGTTVTMTKWIR